MDYTATSAFLWLTVAVALLVFRPFLPGRITTVENFRNDYQYIIVGGGTAGSVLASRLSQDRNVTVLLLEAGEAETNVPGTDVPLFGLSHIGSSADWGEYSSQQDAACLSMTNKRCYLPRAKVLGGGSAINCGVWDRGHPRDYDQWEAAGCVGWGHQNVSHYFRKLERNTYDRGSLGPVDISNHAETPLSSIFIEAAIQAGQQLSPKPVESMGFRHAHSNTAKGTRVSTVSAYLWSAANRENLHIATEAFVTKVIIEKKRAVGVEVNIKGKMHVVKTSKEVILSAGTVGSAKLLMLSGIGPKNHLREMGIALELDLPVGNNVLNHITTDVLQYAINTSDAITSEKLDTTLEKMKYAILGTGLRSLPCGLDGIGFSTTEADSVEAPPSLQYFFMVQTLGHEPAAAPTIKKAFNYPDELFEGMHGGLEGMHGFIILPILMHPKSSGYIRLSSKDPRDAPRHYANYLQHPYDIKTMTEGIRVGQNLTSTEAFKTIGAAAFNRVHPECKELTFDSDAYMECFIRHNTLPMYHYVGSCKMGANTDSTAVVNPSLKVRGIAGLRVVDASVMPTLPTGGTNAAVVMIAEKAVDLIRNSG